MGESIAAISTGILAFTATNIDDLLILLLFFSQVNATFTYKHIITGQYLGFFILIVASLSGLFGGLVLSAHWIGLLGLMPIAIGISSLVNGEEDSSEEDKSETEDSEELFFSGLVSPQTYSVASVTIANGSDNISVYVPLFASGNLASFLIVVSIFCILIGVWCYVAYQLTRQKEIADILTRYGNYFVPFVLIGLGTFILLKSNALSLTKLIASYFCITILVKKNENSS
ncbi:transporter [Scytonema sp. UIC 10036]|uniref:cadmium resistance transporter n=1 Tax=Scytonema sp. UIC 10036 TaxID=2304196 RepID=UPI0012DA7044|nr:cadmium resistance transporter [Scytonema sp. UIC 10036]MUG98342.1 transporter [Scytonema sp. UIC 10036]